MCSRLPTSERSDEWAFMAKSPILFYGGRQDEIKKRKKTEGCFEDSVESEILVVITTRRQLMLAQASFYCASSK
jgi:hypothetical protein